MNEGDSKRTYVLLLESIVREKEILINDLQRLLVRQESRSFVLQCVELGIGTAQTCQSTREGGGRWETYSAPTSSLSLSPFAATLLITYFLSSVKIGTEGAKDLPAQYSTSTPSEPKSPIPVSSPHAAASDHSARRAQVRDLQVCRSQLRSLLFL
jgi:hypothetical protein